MTGEMTGRSPQKSVIGRFAREQGVIGRFAPTPSGRLHLGNLFCSLLAWLSAKAEGGEVILRIEDLDRERTSLEYTEQAENDLRFLGLSWDRGGLAGGNEYLQSRRSAFYRELLEWLEAQGLVYPCFCSRAELHAADAPHASDGDVIYSGKCRELSPEAVKELSKKRSPALRLKVPAERITFSDLHYGEGSQELEKECGDFILRRSDGVFAYQLAVVGDDAAMGVTQVVRGRDLLSSTPRQIYLYRLLGLPVPQFAHTPLLLASDGRRLSKRDRDVSLDALRERGLSPEEITGRLAYLAGLLDKPEAASPRELISVFSWDKVPKKDISLPEGLF